MELDEEKGEVKTVWCIVATVITNGQASKGTRNFEPGTKVYCFPPSRSGSYESVKVVGPDRKSGKIVSAVVSAGDLENWRAEEVINVEVLQQISPPWDSSDVSKGVAEGIAAWKAGGHWPVLELRRWNRSRAEVVVGEGTLLRRMKNGLLRLLGKA